VFKGSPAHVGALSSPATRADIRPVIPGDRRRTDHAVWVSCRLSATGLRFLSILFPPGCSAPLAIGLPGIVWTPTGFPRSTRPSHDRIGRPLHPEAQRCSHDRSDLSGRRSPPLPAARPYHPGPHPISGAVHYGASSRVHSRSPARSSPRLVVPLDGSEALGLFPGLRTPAGRTCGARQSGDGHRALTRNYASDIVGPPFREFPRNVRPRVARSDWT